MSGNTIAALVWLAFMVPITLAVLALDAYLIFVLISEVTT